MVNSKLPDVGRELSTHSSIRRTITGLQEFAIKRPRTRLAQGQAKLFRVFNLDGRVDD
jgi:hypothetical protein